MSDKVAVIASILKPVDDTRMYEKLGLSIRESNKYLVNIIGFEVKNPPYHQGIFFHTLYRGKRTSAGRLWAPIKFFFKLTKLRPDLMVICTPELLVPAVLFKCFFRTTLWYDVQENYRRNVWFQDAYPSWIKPWLSLVVWLVEGLTRPFINRYLLAERGYLRELKFVNGKHIVLENKFIPQMVLDQRKKTPRVVGTARQINRVDPSKDLKGVQEDNTGDEVRLIFTGTCSQENGIMEAVTLATTLFQCQYPVRLTIAGQVPDVKLLTHIQRLLVDYDFIELVGHGSLVPHAVLMQLAANADFGLVAHQPNPSTENCIPTKIYEYLGLKLPMLLQSHPLWESVVNPYQAAIALDFNQFQPEALWTEMHKTKFYIKEPGAEIGWEQEEQKLLEQL